MSVKKSAWRAVLLLLAALTAGLLTSSLLAGCGPAVTPVPLPTPSILKVQSSPALADQESSFYECAHQEGLTLILTEDQPDLSLRWGPLTGWQGYAAVIGQESWAVVVHPSNPLDQLSLEQLQAIFTGQIKSWQQAGGSAGDIQEIHAWAYPAGSDLQQVFEGSMGGQALPDGQTYIAPDPPALLESVAQDPAAVGFVPRRWLDKRVKALNIQDLDASRMAQPILALSAAEPLGSSANWLVCLQERLQDAQQEGGWQSN